jgi:copper(I)-binding protein
MSGHWTRGATASLVIGAIATTIGLAGCRPDRGGQVTGGAIVVSHAVAPAPASPSEATAFLVIDNRGATPDTLVSAGSPDAEMAMLHTVAAGRMETVATLAVPAGGRVTLAPGGYHLMLHGLKHAVVAGDTLTLQLRFAGAGELVVRAPVLRYSEAVDELK